MRTDTACRTLRWLDMIVPLRRGCHETGHWLGLSHTFEGELFPDKRLRRMTVCAASIHCACHLTTEQQQRQDMPLRQSDWLNALCRFHAGGCSEPNDGVDDTAQEAQPQFGCPATPPDSCPRKPSGQPRLDPIHSYMDYSPDACMTLVRRLTSTWPAVS